jgi:hypothetical protein
MAQFYKEDWQGYNVGEHPVDDGDWIYWLEEGNWEIVSSPALDGKALECEYATGVGAIRQTGITKMNNGEFRFNVRLDRTNSKHYVGLELDENGWLRYVARAVFDNGDINFLDEKVGDYSADTWYLIEIEWRSADDKLRIKIDQGDWSDWRQSEYNRSVGEISKVRIGSKATGTMWINDFGGPAATGEDFKVTVTDSLSMASTLQKKTGFGLTKTESVGVKTPTPLIKGAFYKILSDTISLTASIVKKVSFKKIATSTIRLIDTVIVDLLGKFKETILDTISLVGDISKKVSFKKVATDTLTLVKSVIVTAKENFKELISDTMSLVSSVSKKVEFKKILTTEIKLSSIVSIFSTAWTELKKSAKGAWTHIAKSTPGTWSNQTKNK